MKRDRRKQTALTRVTGEWEWAGLMSGRTGFGARETIKDKGALYDDNELFRETWECLTYRSQKQSI